MSFILQDLQLFDLYPNLVNLDMTLSAYAAHRSRSMQLSKRSIERIDEEPEPLPRQPPTKLRPFLMRSPTPNQSKAPSSQRPSQQGQSRTISITSSLMKPVAKPAVSAQLNNLITQATQKAPATSKLRLLQCESFSV